MGKLTKKNKAFMIMILGIILLVGGIAVSISLGAKNIDINTIASMAKNVNFNRIVPFEEIKNRVI